MTENLPDFEDAPTEMPQIQAEAELVLPTEIYAGWMRAIKVWLERVGAVNGEDFRAVVSLAGFENGRQLWKVKWKALTERGVAHLNAMAASLRLLEQQKKELGHDGENPRKDGENG